MQDGQWWRWLPGHLDIHRNHIPNTSATHEIRPKDSATKRAGSDRDHFFRRRHGVIGFLQRETEMIGHRSHDQKDVSVPRAGGNEESEPVHVVVGIGQFLHFVKTSATIADIDNLDMNRVGKSRGELIRFGARCGVSPLVSGLPGERPLSFAHAAITMNAFAIVDRHSAVVGLNGAGRTYLIELLRLFTGHTQIAGRQPMCATQSVLMLMGVMCRDDPGFQSAVNPSVHKNLRGWFFIGRSPQRTN